MADSDREAMMQAGDGDAGRQVDDDSKAKLDGAMGEAAVSRGWLSEVQLNECIDAARRVREVGIRKTLAGIMVDKGLITEIQAKTVERLADESAPDIIAGFELLGKLGEGGMGAVFKARQLSMDRLVALKILPEGLAKNPEFAERFIREARMAAKLDHVNIIRGIDVGKEGDVHYFAMEFVEGESVGDLMKREGMLPEDQVLAIAVQIARALEHAWQEAKLIHRDIKPDNIMLTKNNIAKLADLGLARTTDQESTMMTRTGVAMGTPHYISPEQARGERNIDIRTDVYSFGATLYHMLVGETPFGGSSAAAVITNHLTKTLTPVHVRNPGVSERTSRIVWKMMRKDPAQRYASPTALLKDLELVADGKDPALASAISLDPAELSQSALALLTSEDLERIGLRPRKPKWLVPVIVAAAFVLVLLVVVVALVVLTADRGREEELRAQQLAAKQAEEEKRQVEEEKRQVEEQAARLAAAHKVLDTARGFLKQAELVKARVVLEGGREEIEGAGLDEDMEALLADITEAEKEEQARLEREKQEKARQAELEARKKELARFVAVGDTLYKSGNYEGALTSYKAAQEVQDSAELQEKIASCNYEIAVKKGRQAEAKGDLAAAIAAFQEALKIKHDEQLLSHLGKLYAKRERAAEAEALSAKVFATEIAAATEVEKLKAALEDARGAIKLMGEETATDIKERAAELEAELRYRASMDAAREYVAQNRWLEARTAAREALAARPDDADAAAVLRQAQEALSRPRSIPNSLGMTMLWVQGGEFRMGADSGDEDERPAHLVKLMGFYISRCEVTNTQYEKYDPKHSILRFKRGNEPDMPVVNVTWRDAVGFCRWLSRKKGKTYRLPTEAEWEYAARGTDGRAYPWGDESPSGDGTYRANFGEGEKKDSWGRDGFAYLAPVGSFFRYSSPFGCQDMAGNVWEWCLDWYGPYPAAATAVESSEGAERAIRGGSWYQDAASLRSSNRWAKKPTIRSPIIGFRCVMEAD